MGLCLLQFPKLGNVGKHCGNVGKELVISNHFWIYCCYTFIKGIPYATQSEQGVSQQDKG